MLYTLLIVAAMAAMGETAGSWSLWTPWFRCTASCGGGVELRHRNCDNPKPTSPAENCVGDEVQTRRCNEDACPESAAAGPTAVRYFNKWGSFECTKSCGGGVKLRVNNCFVTRWPWRTAHTVECRGKNYTTQTSPCNTQSCPTPQLCFATSRDCYRPYGQGSYIGGLFETETGKFCQHWSSQTPHKHHFRPENFPEDGRKYPENYCRIPDYEPRPWCYTLNPKVRFEYCDAGPVCSNKGCPIAFSVASSWRFVPSDFTKPSRIPFGEAIYNKGGYFHRDDNSFHAPVKGIYSFSFSAVGEVGRLLGLHLYTERPGHEKYMVARAYDSSPSGVYSGAGATVSVPLEADETASIYMWAYSKEFAVGGADTTDSHWSRSTLFSGKLEQQLP